MLLVTEDLVVTYYATAIRSPGALVNATRTGRPSASPSSHSRSEDYATHIYNGGCTREGYRPSVYDSSGRVTVLGEVMCTYLGLAVGLLVDTVSSGNIGDLNVRHAVALP